MLSISYDCRKRMLNRMRQDSAVPVTPLWQNKAYDPAQIQPSLWPQGQFYRESELIIFRQFLKRTYLHIYKYALLPQCFHRIPNRVIQCTNNTIIQCLNTSSMQSPNNTTIQCSHNTSSQYCQSVVISVQIVPTYKAYKDKVLNIYSCRKNFSSTRCDN